MAYYTTERKLKQKAALAGVVAVWTLGYHHVWVPMTGSETEPQAPSSRPVMPSTQAAG